VNRAPRQGIRLRACPMRRLLSATLLLLFLLPAAAAFAADRPQDLLVDACRDEKVDGTYSQRTYRGALDQLPADSDQYTACRDVIDRARLAALRNRANGGSSRPSQRDATTAGPSTGRSTGGGGSAPATGTSDQGSDTGRQTPSNRRRQGQRTRTKRRAPQPTTSTTTQPTTGEKLLPAGPVGSNVSAAGGELPTSVIVLLAALALCGLLAASIIGWNRVVARRTR
jgi:hypothetical protein